MRNGIGIGRIFSIDVRADWSWVFVFILVTWNLGMISAQAHSAWG